jgi:hypothetical protein
MLMFMYLQLYVVYTTKTTVYHETVIIILVLIPHKVRGSRTHRANPDEDTCTLSPPYVVTIFARRTQKMLYGANLVCRLFAPLRDAVLSWAQWDTFPRAR